MAASSSWKLILSILLVAFSGCALIKSNHESGSIIVEYDRSTGAGVCQLYLEYKGNRHQQNLVARSYSEVPTNPLHMHVFSSESATDITRRSGLDFYGVSGGCVLDPSQDNRLPAVAIIQLAINLPSPHLEVENSKTHRGKTPRALLEEGGFSVKFNNKNESGVTSLPDFFDDELTLFSAGYFTTFGSVVGIKVSSAGWCPGNINIKSGTLHILPEDDLAPESKDTIKLLQNDGWPLSKWKFEGVVQGYNC